MSDRYQPNRTCAKCGYASIKDHISRANNMRIRRTCLRCRYEWDEYTLDHDPERERLTHKANVLSNSEWVKTACKPLYQAEHWCRSRQLFPDAIWVASGSWLETGMWLLGYPVYVKDYLRPDTMAFAADNIPVYTFDLAGPRYAA